GPRHGTGRSRRPSRTLGVSADDPSAAWPRHRVCRPPRRESAQPSERNRGGQRHVDRGRDRPGEAALPGPRPRDARRPRARRRPDGARVRPDGPNLSPPGAAHEVWDVTDPAKPAKASTVASGLTSTHKNFWECDTGTAYLISGDLVKTDPLQLGPSGWRTWRMTKVYDLSDPTRPVFVRDFGLAGQQPGSTGPIPVAHGVHGPIVLGNRVYFAYGTSGEGLLQIVDRQKLLSGPKEPTAANLNAPEVSRLQMAPNWGGHTAFPILRVPIADWAPNTKEQTRDFVFLVSEAIANECRESRHASFVIDITAETRPFGVATFQVPESKGGFC